MSYDRKMNIWFGLGLIAAILSITAFGYWLYEDRVKMDEDKKWITERMGTYPTITYSVKSYDEFKKSGYPMFFNEDGEGGVKFLFVVPKDDKGNDSPPSVYKVKVQYTDEQGNLHEINQPVTVRFTGDVNKPVLKTTKLVDAREFWRMSREINPVLYLPNT